MGLSGRQNQSSCFVMMPFSNEFRNVYEKAIFPAVKDSNLESIRVDEIITPGEIPKEIREGIQKSTVCIADLTGLNPNVMYEIALAHAMDKPVILLIEEDTDKIPFDLQHMRVIFYRRSGNGIDLLRDKLTNSLDETYGTSERILTQMLVPSSLSRGSSPFVIAASPLSYRQAFRSSGGFKKLRSTFSDYVGIRGLIQAFGSIFGLNELPELVNPDDFINDVARCAMNIYCIASPKANRWTGILLEDFYNSWNLTPRIEFKVDPDSKDFLNPVVMIRYDEMHDRWTPPGVANIMKNRKRLEWDFGFVIRGPHPANKNNMVMILAGRGSLGTQAACLAATNPKHIRQIERLLDPHDVDLQNHQEAFWCVCGMECDMESQTKEPNPDTLVVYQAGPLKKA